MACIPIHYNSSLKPNNDQGKNVRNLLKSYTIHEGVRVKVLQLGLCCQISKTPVAK